MPMPARQGAAAAAAAASTRRADRQQHGSTLLPRLQMIPVTTETTTDTTMICTPTMNLRVRKCREEVA